MMTETALAAHVSTWLRVQGWDVYPEVTLDGPRADIVARRNGALFVVECKTTFGLAVIAQATNWRRFAHLVAVAVPGAKNSDARAYAIDLCRREGLGVLVVRGAPEAEAWRSGVEQKVAPPLRRRVNPRLAEALVEGHKEHEPGNATASYHSPYRETCRQLARVVVAEPGIALRAAVEKLRHHYSSDQSARGSLAKWIEGGKVAGVRIERDGRTPRLYPVTA